MSFIEFEGVYKRYKMGEIADQFASKIYLTNDNPRSENPISIIKQINLLTKLTTLVKEKTYVT